MINANFKAGVYSLNIRTREMPAPIKKEAFLTCTEDDTHTIDMDGEWIEEDSSASFYLKYENIDGIIEALQKVKEYLKHE